MATPSDDGQDRSIFIKKRTKKSEPVSAIGAMPAMDGNYASTVRPSGPIGNENINGISGFVWHPLLGVRYIENAGNDIW